MGKYWRYPHWMYTVLKEPKVCVGAEEIALVIAKYGASIPPERRLGTVVECDNFQDARRFLLGGGEKGQQLAILPTGEYRINTRLFTVITADNAEQHNEDPRNLRICRIPSDMIGIVNTMDGAPIETDKGEIAGSPILGHDNFQNPQKFIKGGGRRGLQEEVLPSGPWKLNPWFIKVEKVLLTEVPEGTVGVVVSLIGKEVSKKEVDSTYARNSPIKQGYELVEEGYRGVWKEPLSIGKHPINTKVKRVVIVPTHQIILDWSNDKTKADDNYDKKLGVLKPVSVDGFVLDIVVRQSFRVPREKAPEMISQIGSPDDTEPETVATSSGSSSYRRFKPIRDLITRVLGPTVENYFYSAVQDRKALDFHQDRRQQQRAAADRLKAVLNDYGVEAIDTLISEIDLPDSLQKLLNNSTIEKLKADLLRDQQETEEEIRKLTYLKAITAIQADLVQFQQGVQIEELKAKAREYQTLAEAKSTEEQGKAQAKVQADLMQAIVDVIGRDGYVDIEKLKQLANFKFPHLWINNSGGSNSGLSDVFMASMLENIASGNSRAITGSSQLLEASAMEAIENQISCSNCGTKNLSNHQFCSKCGTRLTGDITSK